MKLSVRPEIARRYWTMAVTDELAHQLSDEGYEIHRNYQRGDVTVSLAGKKGDAWRFFEPIGAQSIANVAKVQQLARELNAEVRIVPINPPRETSIEVQHLDSALLEWIRDHEMPSNLFDLGHHTSAEAVFGSEVTSIAVDHETINVIGTALVGAAVYSGEDDLVDESAYPLQFDIELRPGDLTVASVNEMTVDTSEFYGRD